MNACLACGAPTHRAVLAKARPHLLPVCTPCLSPLTEVTAELIYAREPDYLETLMAKKTAPAPLPVDTVTEATQASEQAKHTLAALRALPVTNQNLPMVGEVLKDVKARYKALEDRQREITAPMRAAEKSVRDLFRPGLNALAEAEALLKAGIAKCQAEQFRANQEATARAQAALAQGNVLEAAKAATALAPVEALQGITSREVWTFRIVDPAQVPRELCTPDEAKIRAAVAAGAREIPGVVVELGTQITVRA